MNELTIYSFLQILASNSLAKDVAMSIDGYVKEFIIQNTPARFNDEFMAYYIDCKAKYKELRDEQHDINGFKIVDSVCNSLRKKLNIEERIVITIKLLEILPYNFFDPNYAEFVGYVSNSLKVSIEEHNTLKSFVTSTTYVNIKSSRLAILKGNDENVDSSKLITRVKDGLNGELHFLKVASIQAFLMKYYGTDSLFVDEHEVVPELVYMFHVGSTLVGDNMTPILYSDLVDKTNQIV